MSQQPKVIVASALDISVRSMADIPELIGRCLGADGLILTEDDLSPEFFDLTSGLAGELLQKFVNYRLRVALVLPNPASYGERFIELAREHASHSIVRFVRSRGEAEAWLLNL